LLVRLSAIGDVVVATPVIHALRTAYPRAYLAWLVEEKAADVVRGNPELDEVIVWPRSRHRMGTLRLLGELRRRRFEIAIDFQGLLRSAALVWMSGARYRIASVGTREGSACIYNIRVPRTGDASSRQRCLDLLRPLGIRSQDRPMRVWFGPDHEDAAERLLEKAVPGTAGAAHRLVCLVPATTWRHKHWIEARWAEVADGLAREGHAPLFLGGPGDRALIGRIQARMRQPSASLAGETSLKEAAALLQQADLAITVDTGLMHIAVAVGTPVVALCGPSYWPGFEDYAGASSRPGQSLSAGTRFQLLRKPYPCSPCLRRPTCQNDDCMTALTTAEVLAAARTALAGFPMAGGVGAGLGACPQIVE
jgi:heptosyltransferase-1